MSSLSFKRKVLEIRQIKRPVGRGSEAYFKVLGKFVFTWLLVVTLPLTGSAAGRPSLVENVRTSAGVISVQASPATTKPGGGVQPRPLSASELAEGHRRFVKVVQGIRDFSERVRFPKKIDLQLADLEVNPRANFLTNQIFLGLKYARTDERGRVYTQHPNAMVAVSAHEFGHLIFGENILDVYPRMPQIRAIFIEIQKVEEQWRALATRLEDLSRRAPSQQTEREANALQAQLAALQQRYTSLGEQVGPDLNLVRDRTSGYNEFFADVVAVLYTEQPNSVADSIHFAMDLSRKKQKTIQVSVENRFFEKRGVRPRQILGHHGLLQEARNWIWEEYLSRPTVLRHHKNRVLLAVIRALRAETKWSF
ncbi:MAG: hypothetical protein NDI61_14435, partial [Bdellovibrionaceae bacterium]|nr:hypothetical protein [Pseudobdellovibrionaceae bacterium]